MRGGAFLHLVRYRSIQTVRDRSQMFWALAFPIILGTFFYVSFGSGDMGEEMEPIPVAVVADAGEAADTKAFMDFLEQMDGDVLQVLPMEEEAAREALQGDEIVGIFDCRRAPSLTVAGTGISQSILKSLMDGYDKNAALIASIVRDHPEKIPELSEAAAALGQRQEMTENVGVKGRTLDTNISYFFALIAYACLAGVFLGTQASLDSQADLSALGARQSVAPVHRLQMILTDLLVLFFIHFGNVLILTCYIRFVLKVDLGGDVPALILVEWMGSMIGISMGILVGRVGRLGMSGKMGLCVFLTLFPSFLAGLMFGQMKNVVERHCPIVNRINPAAVLSDALYSISVYNDGERLIRSVAILSIMSVGMVAVAYLAVRRVSYDSI